MPCLKEINPERILESCSFKGCDNPVRKPHKRSNGNYKYYSTCSECNNYKTRYGLTTPQVKQLSALQSNRCAICYNDLDWSKTSKANSAVVDHNHKTGKVRSLLCNHCNRALGLFKDDADIVRAAANYLTKHTENKNG